MILACMKIASKAARYRDAITVALEVLGTGDCCESDCEGCRYEREEARQVLAAALGEAEPHGQDADA